MNRKVGAGFLRTRGRVGRRADQRQIRDRCRAAAERKRRQQQRSKAAMPSFFDPPTFVRKSPRRWYEPCSDKTSSSSDSAMQVQTIVAPKRLKPEQQIEPLGLQYDRTKILCRSATRWMPRLTPNLPSSIQRGDELENEPIVSGHERRYDRNPGREKVRPRSLCDEPRAGDGEQRPGARSLSQAARERRTQGQAAQRTRRGDQDLQRGGGILAVGQRPVRGTADEDRQGLSRSVGLVGAPPCRRTGAAGDRAVAARQAVQGPRSGNRTSFSIS